MGISLRSILRGKYDVLGHSHAVHRFELHRGPARAVPVFRLDPGPLYPGARLVGRGLYARRIGRGAVDCRSGAVLAAALLWIVERAALCRLRHHLEWRAL